MSNTFLDISALIGFILFAFSGWSTIALCLAFLGYYFFHQWIQGEVYNSSERLEGKTVIVTGGASGIGKEVARILSSKGARVVIGCRDLKKGRKVVDNIRAITHGQVVLLPLDLSSLRSVREFAEQILQTEKHGVHILVNNAGSHSSNFQKSVDGHEVTFQVNYLGHFLLVHLLLPLLKASAPARIINMTLKPGTKGSGNDFDNVNSEKDFHPKGSFEKSKMANALFTKELAKRLKGTGVSAYGVYPGYTNTQLLKLFTPSLPGHAQTLADILVGIASKTPESGAQTTVYCALNDDLRDASGNMYSECKESEMKPSATDEETQRALWSLSEKFLNLDPSLASPSPPMKVLDINDTPLPPLPADATPETEESPSFPPKEEKTEEMILQEDPEPKATYSSPAFDDAPPAPSTQELSNVMGSLKELQKGVTHSDDPFVKEDNIKELKTKPKQAFSNLDQEEPPLIAKDSFKGLQAEPQDSKAPTFSSPAFDDAPAPPNAENISNILDNFQNIEGKSGFEPIASNVRNVFMASTPQSFAVEEEIVSEVIHSSNEALMSSPPPSSSGSESLDLLDNIKNFDKSSLSHPANFKDVALLPSKETIEDEKKLMAQEISKNKEVFSDVKEQILDVSPKDLKNVNTVVKESLPDKYDILSEKGHQEVLSELSEFDGLQQSKSPVTVDPQEFLRREIVNKEIEGFSVEHLAKTEPSQAEILPTMEDISNERKEIESDIQKSKNIYEGVMSEVSDFESSSLRPVDTEESSYMPDKIDLSVERALKGVMEEVKEGSPHLSHVEHTKEPLDPTALMAEEINRNNTLDSLLHFDKAALKHSEMEEKSVLPSEEDIKEERMRNDFTHDVEAFEKSSLKSTPLNERNLLPDSKDIHSEKQHVELLSGIESFPRDELKVSEIKEPLSPSVLAKQELNRSSVLSDVESYDKGNLSHFIPVEKSSLPSASEIVEERQHIELLSGIESFDPSELKSGVKSKEPLSPLELAKQELTHKSLLEDVETYDKEKGLSHITTEVKNLLPTSADILLEREGDPKSRNMSGSSSGSLELKPGQMGGSSGVPLSAPLTMDDGRTSSSDEWVKLDQQSGGDLLG